MKRPGLPSDVLIVEDNFIIALDTESLLRDLGVPEVRVAATVEAAKAAIEKREPDFALIDVDLNGQSGYTVGLMLVERRIPFVFATGYAELIAPPPKLAMTPIIAKPYTTDTLLQIMKRLCA